MPASIRSLHGVSLATVGEEGYVASALPNGWSGASRPAPLIFCHGAGQTLSAGNEGGVLREPYQRALIHDLAQRFTLYAGDFGGMGTGDSVAYGNDNVTLRIEAARTYLANSMGSTGAVTLVGVSMGALSALNYARAYPSNVRAVIGIIPALDMADMALNRAGFAAYIEGAYPILTPGLGINWLAVHLHNPINSGLALTQPALLSPGFASSLSPTLPIMLLTSSTDTTTVPETAAAFVAARPQTKRVNVGSNGHSFISVGDARSIAVRFAQVLA